MHDVSYRVGFELGTESKIGLEGEKIYIMNIKEKLKLFGDILLQRRIFSAPISSLKIYFLLKKFIFIIL